MLIAYDAQIFASKQYGGVARYFSELCARLALRGDVSIRIVAPFYVTRYLTRLPPSCVIGRHVNLRLPYSHRVASAIATTLCRRPLRGLNPDIVHETYYSYRPSGTKRSVSVLTVFDMIHERFPQYFPRLDDTTYRKRAAISRADHIFCISDTTKKDLMDIYGVTEDRVSVVYLGFREPLRQMPNHATDPRIEADFLKSPFLLYVGNRGGYKNFDKLLTAYAHAPGVASDFRLVCFGGGPFSPKEVKRHRHLGLPDARVIQISGDDSLLSAAYGRASALVCPSLYEGFGLPPVEAMAHGCPVVCSDAGSLPEIVGPAGVYFDPNSAASIAASLTRVLSSPAYRAELVRNGKERCRLFSWDRCVEETMAVYRKLVPHDG
jgi:glycosyltransferase involved in cell wall biosynthesis